MTRRPVLALLAAGMILGPPQAAGGGESLPREAAEIRRLLAHGPWPRYATLREVVRHYSDLNEERLHADGERILRPLRLSDGAIDDLVAFLQSLSDAASPMPRRAITPTCS